MTAKELNTVWYAKHTGKIHLNKDCSYLNQGDNVVEKDPEVLPEWKIDVCSYCEDYHETWLEGIQTDKPQCQQCGRKLETSQEYCAECWDRIQRKKARR